MNGRSRPKAAPEIPTKKSKTSVADSARFSPLATADEFATAVDGSFVVVVLGPAGRYRRRVFLTLKSAERAAERAIGRGQSVRIVLAELKPLYDVTVVK